MGFRPLHDRVVVKRLDSESKTAGGIIIPDTAKEKPMEGKVISVGPGARDDHGRITPLDVKKGDTVLFGKWSGTEVKIDGDDLLDNERVRHNGRYRLTIVLKYSVTFIRRKADKWLQKKLNLGQMRAKKCSTALTC